MAQEQFVCIPVDKLYQFSIDCFSSVGFIPEHAKIISDSLIEADLRGLNTHGVLRIPMYIKRVLHGVLDPNADVTVALETDSFTVFNANNGMGQIASIKAMDYAIEKASEKGLYLTGVRNSNHFGTAAYYTMRAAGRGMIGICCSNTESLMPAPGGAEKIVGNNPFSLAFPGGNHPPIVVDMAVSAAAIGKVVLAAKEGKSIPIGWATDKFGVETLDPLVALDQGFLLPVGGPKGYGLSIAIDILAGLLMGAGFGGRVRCPFNDYSGPQDLGHMFLALRIDAFMEDKEYYDKVQELIERTKNSTKASGVSDIYLPGEIENSRAVLNRGNGVNLHVDLVHELALFADTLNIKENRLQEYLNN